MTHLGSKQQGDIGVAAATLYYTKLGLTVSYPLTDAARYDLVVDRNNKLYRVQCKTSTHKTSEYGYSVSLATSGGNQSWNKVKKKISKEECDLIFIWCENDTYWEIPSEDLDGRSSFTASPTNAKYLVHGSFPEGLEKDSLGRVKGRKKNSQNISSFSRPTKIVWPELDILKQMVLESSYSQVGKQLGVSDNAVRKHIKTKEDLCG